MPSEVAAAVIAARVGDEEGQRGMEGHCEYGVAPTEKGSAGQIIGAVDTNRRSAAQLARADTWVNWRDR